MRVMQRVKKKQNKKDKLLQSKWQLKMRAKTGRLRYYGEVSTQLLFGRELFYWMQFLIHV